MPYKSHIWKMCPLGCGPQRNIPWKVCVTQVSLSMATAVYGWEKRIATKVSQGKTTDTYQSYESLLEDNKL